MQMQQYHQKMSINFSNGKLSQLAQSTQSEQLQNSSLRSNESLQLQQQQQQNKEYDLNLQNISLKNIKSKQQIQIQSKQNQTIMLNLNNNIDDLFKKITSLTDQINIQLKFDNKQSLKQKNIQFQNNILSTDHKYTNITKNHNQTKSTPEINNKFIQTKSYRPIFFHSLLTQNKQNGVNMKLFQIGKSLGHGKFGQVVQCKNLKTNYLYALKKIFKSLIQQYKMHDQLLTQLKILSLINHPNIVKAYQSFTDSYHIFILMQYIQGVSLVKKFKSTEQQIKNIICQVLNALKYLHSNNICHRDLKPQNIILTHQNTVKICDFGWASYNQTQMNILCGTLDYVSYQMVHQISYTNKVDLWNVGVLTYELINGYAPFKSSSKNRTFQNVKNLNYTFNEDIQISQDCKKFISSLLKPQSQRMTIEQALQHSFLQQITITVDNKQNIQIEQQNIRKSKFQQILNNQSE